MMGTMKYCVGFCTQNSYCVGEAGKAASSSSSGPPAVTFDEASLNHEKESSSFAESSDSSSEVSVQRTHSS